MYEIFNHEVGSITFFEHFENIERWEEDNLKDPEGYKNYGVRLITSAETDVWYKEI
jgi:hypothetical protein